MANWTIPYAGLKGNDAKAYLRLQQDEKVIYGTLRCQGYSHYRAMLIARNSCKEVES